ncbi:MAG TPA: cupredoxin domain-containing protein [Candidatus Limnocylindrales bacterium]|nr:cupredoxin domain-containing protein [Candidatus Limnocylindrales bacterium]
MTDETNRPEGSDRSLPARRDADAGVPARTADRFTAPRQTRAVGGLTSERAAKIVRQSGDARWVAFLGLVIVALFVIVYYFYELGVPIINTTPRMQAEADLQQVTSVERGYNLFEANCAKCHGANGEGGVGPVLNDQNKLFSHLTEAYIRNVLEVGGRYVCGNPKSVMPVWSNTNGGPLNYVQIEDLIAFIRADSTQEYVKRSATLNEPIIGDDGKVETFKGWRDVTFKPDPSASPVPDCYLGDKGSATPAPAASLGPDAPTFNVVGLNIAFDKKTLDVAANTPFAIDFDNQDPAGVQHNVEIRDDTGQVLQDQPLIDGGQKTTYVYSGLPAGTYTFICKVHPIPNMTGTLTVK